ncbi:MAG: hypothetical protein ACYTBZ_18480, partial [Planctomycetota bacterium]
MKKTFGYNIVGLFIFAVGVIVTVAVFRFVGSAEEPSILKYLILVGGLGISFILSLAPRMAEQWENGVVLRLGKFVGLKGPGLFWVIPLV